MDFRDGLPGSRHPARRYRFGAGLSGAVPPGFGRPGPADRPVFLGTRGESGAGPAR
ncbi:hypothetical protein AB0I39_13685 [Kitasatospora purpeofusca]|uniref:hypothetical protein n=1 Tax=Kitasatospora purpeofusca TaxID=67352 RepID=UPI0033DE5515